MLVVDIALGVAEITRESSEGFVDKGVSGGSSCTPGRPINMTSTMLTYLSRAFRMVSYGRLLFAILFKKTSAYVPAFSSLSLTLS
jgi:hypothetical protein